MSKALRLSEKWFQRGLWLVALVFASFLIGLGSTVVGDLPRVEHRLALDDFMDRAAAQAARDTIQAGERQAQDRSDALEQARLKLQVAQADVSTQRQGFANWIATRRATERAEQDPEVIARTRALDELQARERAARAEVERQQQALLDARQSIEQARRALSDMERNAQGAHAQAVRVQELRVFGYRLALTLPLLLLAGWLFARKRRSTWWPFVWGFIGFALFAFFVELVPYLPSYGGYVRYIVGIVATVLVGRWAIVALQRYLECQRAAEAQPDAQRRAELGYDTALARLAKGVCPGCERAVDLKDGRTDFCPHCGIGLFDHCGQCQARKSTFSRFCPACGTSGRSAA
ncbi:MAG: serine endopeptidase [Proteobacteria bacterium]|nr:serine endopeptidase [Burkholderiales bacterium]MCA0309921.1 serine endopeptidase [Pseudomonadota bacterium]